MKIAYVINSVEGGGAALPVPAVVGALRQCGAEVRIFALLRRDGRALGPIQAAGIDIVVREGGEKDHAAALRWLDHGVALFAPDVIWTSLTRATVLGQLVGARRRLPVVSWQHAAFLRPANRHLLRMTQRLTSLWIADSTSVATFAMRALGIPAARLMTWPIFAANPAAPQAAAWRQGEMVRIASLGRLHRVKGYDLLLAALVELGAASERFEVRIAGEGEARFALQSAVDRAGLRNVKLVGFVNDSGGFLTEQHLYIQPSRSEGFCVAAHEAMQVGLPVIGSAVGEMAHSIVPGKSGYLVPAGDVTALRVALASCLADPAALNAMGAAARERVLERFSPEQFQRAGAAVYQRLDVLCRRGRSIAPPASDQFV